MDKRQRKLSKKIFAEMYAEIAISAYMDDGATFDCVICAFTFRADGKKCEEYFKYGWPRHCGELMKISEPEE
ncbi:MAG: hypothetical protein ACYTFW_00270 [Planctomycetota bacterium]|jgi:hypothetical protein